VTPAAYCAPGLPLPWPPLSLCVTHRCCMAGTPSCIILYYITLYYIILYYIILLCIVVYASHVLAHAAFRYSPLLRILVSAARCTPCHQGSLPAAPCSPVQKGPKNGTVGVEHMRYSKQLHNKQLKYHPVTSTQQGSSRTCVLAHGITASICVGGGGAVLQVGRGKPTSSALQFF
jgi:hypothetical protein